MVDAKQWARVKELFHAALERAEPERSAFLDDACRDDLALRAEIDRLLLAHEQSADFIERPAEFGTPMTGRVLGRLEVGALIGVGGMGEVYVARDVALTAAMSRSRLRAARTTPHTPDCGVKRNTRPN